MKRESPLAYHRPLLLRSRVLSCASIFLLGGLLLPAMAQNAGNVDPTQTRDWAPGAIDNARLFLCDRIRVPCPSSQQSSQPTPSDIPQLETDRDPHGQIATFQPGGATTTEDNAFFQNIGANGRTCFTCHQPQTGWTISAASTRLRFETSGGMDPLFRPVDGATCQTDDVSTPFARLQAYIRIGIPMPAGAQFAVTHVDDPYGCTTNPVTGLTSPTTGIVSMYRRPLPSTNLGFLTTIMWDGREPSLASQSVDATLIHA